jgi:plasmid stabilization system protein ParE
MINLSDQAIIDLRKIRERIAEQDLDLAIRMVDKILDKCERLARHPNMGRPGREPETRELSVNPWIVVYRQVFRTSKDDEAKLGLDNEYVAFDDENDDEAQIEILEVWHSRQDRSEP